MARISQTYTQPDNRIDRRQALPPTISVGSPHAPDHSDGLQVRFGDSRRAGRPRTPITAQEKTKMNPRSTLVSSLFALSAFASVSSANAAGVRGAPPASYGSPAPAAKAASSEETTAASDDSR